MACVDDDYYDYLMIIDYNVCSTPIFLVTPKSGLRHPDVSAIMATGSRTPRFVHTPRPTGSLSMVSLHGFWENVHTSH